MSALREWLTAVCFAAAAAGLVRMLAPSGGLRRALQTATGVFLLCVLTVPLLGGFELELDLPRLETASAQAEELRQTVLAELQEAAADRIAAQAEEALRQCGIEEAETEIKMDIDGQGRIVISEMVVRIPRRDAALTRSAERTLAERLGVPVRVDAEAAEETE